MRGWKLEPTGKFDKNTETVVRAFQREKKLFVDGVVGENTWREIGSRTSPSSAAMDFSIPDEIRDVRAAVRELCDWFGAEYRRGPRARPLPEEFVAALTKAGGLAALIPEEYRGGGRPRDGERDPRGGERVGRESGCLPRADVRMETPRHGSEEQKQAYLPAIAAGDLRLQAFGVTEPTAGVDTSAIQTRGERTETGAGRCAARRCSRRVRSTGPHAAHRAHERG